MFVICAITLVLWVCRRRETFIGKSILSPSMFLAKPFGTGTPVCLLSIIFLTLHNLDPILYVNLAMYRMYRYSTIMR